MFVHKLSSHICFSSCKFITLKNTEHTFLPNSNLQVIFLRSREETRCLVINLVHLPAVDVDDHVVDRLPVQVLDVHLAAPVLLHVVGEHGVEDGAPAGQDVLMTLEGPPLAGDAAVSKLPVGKDGSAQGKVIKSNFPSF